MAFCHGMTLNFIVVSIHSSTCLFQITGYTKFSSTILVYDWTEIFVLAGFLADIS